MRELTIDSPSDNIRHWDSGLATLVVAILTLVAIFIAGVIYASDKVMKQRTMHNAQQIGECRALGGFAMTSAETGYLVSCTFPQAGGAR